MINEKKSTVFLIDLDSTVTKEEILPTIAKKKINNESEMRILTEKTMMGTIDFKNSFPKFEEKKKNKFNKI